MQGGVVPDILCVNVVDEGTAGFVAERRQRRNQLTGIADVVELTTAQARPESVRHTLADHESAARFSLLAYLGHGDPGILYSCHPLGQELLSQYDDPAILHELVRQRAVYIFACKTMTPEFAEILLQAAATRAAGFSRSPKHSELNGRQRLGAFDTYVIKALHRGDTRDSILAKRDRFIDVAREDREQDWGTQFRTSMSQFIQALGSFDVYE